jgi:hypothetical protein
MVRAVGVFAKPGMFSSMQGGEIIRPEKPKLAEGKLGLEDEVLLVFIGGQFSDGRSGFNASKMGVEE